MVLPPMAATTAIKYVKEIEMNLLGHSEGSLVLSSLHSCFSLHAWTACLSLCHRS